MIWLLVYGIAAITVAVLAPIKASIQTEGDSPTPVWSPTLWLLRALLGLLWPLTVVLLIAGWVAKRRRPPK